MPNDDIRAGHRPQAGTHSLTQALKLKKKRPPPRLSTPSTVTPSWTEPLPKPIVVWSLYSLNFELSHPINSVESHCRQWELSKSCCDERWVTFPPAMANATHFVKVRGLPPWQPLLPSVTSVCYYSCLACTLAAPSSSGIRSGLPYPSATSENCTSEPGRQPATATASCHDVPYPLSHVSHSTIIARPHTTFMPLYAMSFAWPAPGLGPNMRVACAMIPRLRCVSHNSAGKHQPESLHAYCIALSRFQVTLASCPCVRRAAILCGYSVACALSCPHPAPWTSLSHPLPHLLFFHSVVHPRRIWHSAPLHRESGPGLLWAPAQSWNRPHRAMMTWCLWRAAVMSQPMSFWNYYEGNIASHKLTLFWQGFVLIYTSCNRSLEASGVLTSQNGRNHLPPRWRRNSKASFNLASLTLMTLCHGWLSDCENSIWHWPVHHQSKHKTGWSTLPIAFDVRQQGRITDSREVGDAEATLAAMLCGPLSPARSLPELAAPARGPSALWPCLVGAMQEAPCFLSCIAHSASEPLEALCFQRPADSNHDARPRCAHAPKRRAVMQSSS